MNSVIIPAAGNSTRMGNGINKQFIVLENKEVIALTIEIFEFNKNIDEIILVVKNGVEEEFYNLIKKYNYKKVKIILGGETRRETVYNGLKEVSNETKKILIHDGARPFLKSKYVDEIIDELDTVNAVVLGVKSKDTIKTINDGFIDQTLDRERLINIQTPQAFKKEIILNAYEYAFLNNISATDDSSLVEILGIKVKVKYGDYNNIKVTTPIDVKLGELIIKGEI